MLLQRDRAKRKRKKGFGVSQKVGMKTFSERILNSRIFLLSRGVKRSDETHCRKT